MKDILKKYFGYDTFRPLQEDIINNVLAKKDCLVVMPTGGGKSLCYQLPALANKGLTLVISPLIALMKDQVDVLRGNGIEAAYINVTLEPQEITRIQKQAQERKLKLLYIAPERLTSRQFQDFLPTVQVDLIAIDEAHCISEWGHDFRPDYRNLKQLKNVFPKTPTIALTATATPKVQDDIIEQLKLQSHSKYVSSFDRKNLSLIVLQKRKAYDKLTTLLQKYRGESVIIYCFSRRDTENIALDLEEDGFRALPYHAGLQPSVRARNQERFIKDEVDIIVATIAFGMGIDKPDIRLVVHFTFPKTLEGYYQEIGRAGRDGLPSECVTFYSYGDKRKHEFFFNDIEDTTELERAQQKLKEVVAYFEGEECRRKHVLRYFGETYQLDNCQGCDMCLTPRETFDATEITQKILSCILKTGGRFGKKYTSEVLKGKETEQILRNHHNTLSVFGIVSDYSLEQIKDIITRLTTRGLIEVVGDAYPILSVSQKGIAFLKEKQTIDLPVLKKDIQDIRSTSAEKETLDYDSGLFEVLRSLRKTMADKKGVPPFVIFGDRSLQEMAYYRPSTSAQFARIAGVGAQKLKTYGQMFLAAITAYAKEHNLTEVEIPISEGKEKKRTRKSRVVGNPNYMRTKDLIKQKKSISDIAAVHGFVESTIVNHIEKLLEAGETLDIAYLKPEKDVFEEIQQALETQGDEMLSPVYSALGEKYSYDTIRIVRLFTHQK